MGSILSLLLSYLLLYKYATLFVVAFSAAIILPLPVSALLLAVGAFATHGYFNLPLSIATAVSGNVLGDLTDYYLAKIYGTRVIKKFGADKSRFFNRLEGYIRTDAGLTVFLTRFAGSLDPVASLLSGVAGVRLRTFLFFDFAGNFIQIAGVLYVGYMVGDYWENVSNLIAIISEIILLGVVIFALLKIYKFRKRKD